MRRIVRKRVFWLIVICLHSSLVKGQIDMDRQLAQRKVQKEYDDSDKDRHGNLFAYKLTPRTGDLLPAEVDTVKLNFFHRAIVEGRSIAESYTGSYASPYLSKIYFDRARDYWGDFFFLMPISPLLHRGERRRWFDTKVPYTFMSYLKSGSGDEVEETLHTLFTTNLGKKVNLGGQFDYDYGSGVFAYTNAKNVSYRVFGSYTGDRYEAFLSFGNTNALHAENGGITDDRYITHPEDFTEGKRNLRYGDIPTKYQNTWNRLVYGHARLHHKYSLGFYRKDTVVQKDTTLVSRTFVPVTSFFHDVSYEKGRRHFYSRDPNISAYADTPLIPRPAGANYHPDDRFFLVRLQNTVGVSLLEGFHKWAKMGVSAFVSFDWKRYHVPTVIEGEADIRKQENTTSVGARIRSKSFPYFRYHAQGELAVAGHQAGNLFLSAEALTTVPVLHRGITLALRGFMRNEKPSYLLQQYRGTLYEWSNDFRMNQTLRIGAELLQEDLGTKLFASIETQQNPLYANEDSKPAQYTGNLRVLALGVQQKLRWNVFNWENDIVWQRSSAASIQPLPTLSLYSNLYAKMIIAKVMTLQIGVDAKYHTSYYAPYYNPVTQFFTPQQEVKVGGGAPLLNAYSNIHLKRARFFAQYYNLGALLFRPSYFSMPHYPLYPPRLVYGIAIDLRN